MSAREEKRAEHAQLTAQARQEVERLGPWFHNLHLPEGLRTAPNHPLGDFPANKWRCLAELLPRDLSGQRALDIGCNAGFYSFELAARGAQVVAMDVDDHYLDQARWAARQLGLERNIEFRKASVYDLARWSESYDLVLFMGVFYHLRHPLLALDLVASKVRSLLVFQSLTMPGEEAVEPPPDMELMEREPLLLPGWPKMAFIERKLAGDQTNWWVPNHAAVVALLRASGLTVRDQPGHEIYVCTPMERRDEAVSVQAKQELSAIFG